MALIFLLTFSSLLYCYKTENGNQSLINFSNNACSEFYSYPLWFISKNCYVNLNVMSDTPSMIERFGFKSESHTVTTPDGYILTLFRIKVQNEDTTNKQPILLQHGIGADSRIWTAFGNRSLAFILALQKYDVWLGNMRGTKYSRSHTILKDNNFEYWNFNIDSVAANDIKASLETIASVTAKNHSIIYIGHSLGSVLISMLASEFPTETEQLLRGIILLSPVIYSDIVPRLLPIFLGLEPIGKILEKLNISCVFYNMNFIYTFLQYFCTLFPYACKGIVDFVFGKTNLLKPDDLLIGFSILPSTTSFPILRQFSQQHITQRFQKFDHGKEENLQMYGEEIPPIYDLNKINKLPVFMFYTQHDTFISEKSIKRIYDELGTPKKKYFSVPIGIKEEEYQFNHIDITFNKYFEKLFSNDLVNILKNELS